MKLLKAYFSALALTSALVSAGSVMAQPAPAQEQPNAAEQCIKLKSADERRDCLQLGLMVNALKRNDFNEVGRLQNALAEEHFQTRQAERTEALNLFRAPSP